MASRRKLSLKLAKQIYSLLASCDYGADPIELDQKVLKEALRSGYVHPDRFRNIKDMRGNTHEVVSRFVVTNDGREFIDLFETASERKGR